MATSAEQLILRGIHLMLRMNFSPNDPAAQARHFASLQQDIGPWLSDYTQEMEKPAVDFTITRIDEEPGGGLQ